MAKQAVHSLKVGDVLVSSWGWEQTNLSFYQVVALNGATMVTVKSVKLPVKEVSGQGPMSQMVSFVLPASGEIVADKDAKGIRRKVRNWSRSHDPKEDIVEINDYKTARKYDGQKLYESWYA